MAQRPLARYLESLGAEVITGELDSSNLASASFFIEDLGLPRLEELGFSNAVLTSLNPGLIHVSVTTLEVRPARPMAGRGARDLSHGRRAAFNG